MNIGAMLDLGVDFSYLESQLVKLGLDHEYSLTCQKVLKAGIQATQFDVILTEHHSHNHASSHHVRHFRDIEKIIRKSSLSDFVVDKALEIFALIAQAEGHVHGKDPLEVHFHEVGAVDSIVDIVGACICYEALGKPKIIATPVALGGGSVICAHGTLPVPAPAVVELAKGVPVTLGGADFEQTTPTGMAIIKCLASDFVDTFSGRIDRVAYGAGKKEAKFPNALRIMACQEGLGDRPSNMSQQYMVETNIDDMDGEALSFACQELLKAGALDVFTTAIGMKKGRPACKLSLLCRKEDLDNLERLVFIQTTAIGLRTYQVTKRELNRELQRVETTYGPVGLKVTYLDEKPLRVKAEFDDCRASALAHGVSLQTVRDKAIETWKQLKK
jgi:TIGR00299 family protein